MRPKIDEEPIEAMTEKNDINGSSECFWKKGKRWRSWKIN